MFPIGEYLIVHISKIEQPDIPAIIYEIIIRDLKYYGIIALHEPYL